MTNYITIEVGNRRHYITDCRYRRFSSIMNEVEKAIINLVLADNRDKDTPSRALASKSTVKGRELIN